MLILKSVSFLDISSISHWEKKGKRKIESAENRGKDTREITISNQQEDPK